MAIMSSTLVLTGCGGGGVKPQVAPTQQVTLVSTSTSTVPVTEYSYTSWVIVNTVATGNQTDVIEGAWVVTYTLDDVTSERTKTTNIYDLEKIEKTYSDGSVVITDGTKTLSSTTDTIESKTETLKGAEISRVLSNIGTPTAGVSTEAEYNALPDVDYGINSTYRDALQKQYNNTLDNNYIDTTLAPLFGDHLIEIGATTAWSRGWTGEGINIAIFDSGIDTDHSEFSGKIIATKCFTDECSLGTETIEDVNGHGTHVAGLAAAALDGVGTTGVAPDAKLIIGKIGNDSGSVYDYKLPEAFTWAVSQGADVANISANIVTSDAYNGAMVEQSPGVFVLQDAGMEALGWKTNGYVNYLSWSTEEDLKTAMTGNESVLVVSAGNQGLDYSTMPAQMAALENADGTNMMGNKMLVVGSYDLGANTISTFSNAAGTICYVFDAQGDCATTDRVSDHYILAPGDWVASTANDGGYVTKSGTSMAAPIVTGAVAVVKQMWPQMTGENVASLLLNTADKTIPNYDPNIHGQGLLDLAEATQMQSPPTVPTSSVVTGSEMLLSDTGSMALSGMKVSALSNVMVLDVYDRDFYVDVNNTSFVDTRFEMPTQDALYGDLSSASYDGYARGLNLPVGGGTKLSISSGANNLSVSKRFDDFELGLLSEQDTFLGNMADSYLMSVNGSKTAYVGYNKSVDVGNATFFGGATMGVTSLDVDSSSYMKDASLLMSNSAKMGMKLKLDNESSLGFIATAPVAITSGTADFTMPTDVNADGTIAYGTQTSSLSQSDRELDLGVFYNVASNFDGQGDIKYNLGVFAERRLNAANIDGEHRNQAGVKLSVSFK